MFGKNTEPKPDQTDDNISMVSFKAIALPTITLTIVVTLLGHRGESKKYLCYFLLSPLSAYKSKYTQRLKPDQTEDNLSMVSCKAIALPTITLAIVISYHSFS